jgi:ribose 5-phosphate isomerase B
MKIYIASDHGGFELKNEIVSGLKEQDHDVEDMGPFELVPDDDYPDYALPVAESVKSTPDSIGILICRSGNGMAIAANKVSDIYASLCINKEHARKAREDDNSNVLCLDADYGGDEPIEIVQQFLKAEFAGLDTRHGRRFKKVQDIERKYMS